MSIFLQAVESFFNHLLIQFRALPVGELLVVVVLSIVLSLLLYVVWRRRNHYKLVDLGLHQWLVK